jgi:hypothetical protein
MSASPSPDGSGARTTRPSWIKTLLVISGLLFCAGLVLDVVWDKPVVILLSARPVYTGSIGSLLAFGGVLLLLGTGLVAGVRYARHTA